MHNALIANTKRKMQEMQDKIVKEIVKKGLTRHCKKTESIFFSKRDFSRYELRIGDINIHQIEKCCNIRRKTWRINPKLQLKNSNKTSLSNDKQNVRLLRLSTNGFRSTQLDSVAITCIKATHSLSLSLPPLCSSVVATTRGTSPSRETS